MKYLKLNVGTVVVLHKRLFLFLILIALGLRLIIAWAPLQWLLKRVITDDTFYYFTIAHNITNGFGVTFDRIAPTNGFHPLWMLCIIPIFTLIKDKYIAIHTILTLCALFDTVAIYFLYQTIKKLRISQYVNFLVCFLYTFSPAILVSNIGSMNGLETSINSLMIFIYLFIYSKIIIEKAITYRISLFLGLISGFLFLARTDNVILLIIVSFSLLLKFRGSRRVLLHFVSGSILAFIMISPWLIWSYTTFDSIVQVSGKSVAFMTNEIIHKKGWTIFDYAIRYIKNMADIFNYLSGLCSETKVSITFFIISSIFLVSIIILARAFLRDNFKQRKILLIQRLSIIFPPIIAVPIFILIQTIRSIYLRPWYYFSIIPILIILIAILLDYALALYKSDTPRKNMKFILRGSLLIGILMIFYSLSVLKTIISKPVGVQPEMYKVALVMNTILPPNSRVGAWNAGIYGYFFEKGQVINLDGLVNNKAYEHIVNHTLAKYVREVVKIHYLVDYCELFEGRSPFWDNEFEKMADAVEVIYTTSKGYPNIVIGRLRYY